MIISGVEGLSAAGSRAALGAGAQGAGRAHSTSHNPPPQPPHAHTTTHIYACPCTHGPRLPPSPRPQVRCIQIAIDNPAAKGEMRVFNQFTEMFRRVFFLHFWCFAFMYFLMRLFSQVTEMFKRALSLLLFLK